MAAKTVKSEKQNEYVIVIAGKDDPSLVNNKYAEVIEQLIPQEEKSTGLLVVDADKISITEVLDELRTMPFLTKKRVVVLRNADKFISAKDEDEEESQNRGQDARDTTAFGPAGASNREMLEKYFDNPCPTGVLVMTVSSWPSNTKLAKKLDKIGTLYEMKPPKTGELPQKLTAYAQEVHSKRLDFNTAYLLVQLAGDSLPRLYSEVDKLAAYAGDEKAITKSHVEALIGRNREFDAFEVIEACLKKETGRAIERLRKMFAEDKSADFTTVGAFAYHFRRLFIAKKMMLEGANEYAIGGKARIFYNKQETFALLRRLNLKQIGDQIVQLAEIDFAIKRGQAQPRIAIEQFVMRIASM